LTQKSVVERGDAKNYFAQQSSLGGPRVHIAMAREIRVADWQQADSARPGRVLLLSTNMGMGGGAEEQVIRLAYAFHARGWATLLVSMLPPSPMPAEFASSGVRLVQLGMRRGIPDPRGIVRLARLIGEFRPDVVHSHMTHANLLARAARVIRPFPVLVCTLHALDMAGVERDRGAVFELAHRLTDGLADRTTAICRAAANYYVRRRAVPSAKMVVVPNGIDSAEFAPDAAARMRVRQTLGVEDRFVWLAAGRLESAKAYPTLLRAMARMPEGPGVLLICGRGSRRDELMALVAELGITNLVRFMGLRQDIPDMMRAADGFVLSSDSEGLPLVLLQASAAALPIVATNVGGNGEAVADGQSGYLVPPGDPEALAAGMCRVADLDAADRARLGEAGLRRVREMFEAERIVDQWEQLYGELLRRAQSGGGAQPGEGAKGEWPRPRRTAAGVAAASN
jgi:glycosyltransferase involved in cell wall biosynthesis